MYYKANRIFALKFCPMKRILFFLLAGSMFGGCQEKELPAKYLSNVTVVRETAVPPAETSPQADTLFTKLPAETPASPQKQTTYHIIVSSFGVAEKAHAEKLVAQLKAKNYPATLLFSSQRYRVSIDSFPTETEANAARDKYRTLIGRQDIWVHKAE